MSEKKRFNLSLSMENSMQREAWNIISGFPERERTSAVCWAVCRAYGEQRMEERLREIMMEVLSGLSVVSSGAETVREVSHEASQDVVMDEGIADFLSALQTGQLG